MILYTALRFIGPLCVPINIGKGVRVLSDNFEGVYSLKGFGYNPNKNIKGNNSWRNIRNPALMH